MIIIQIIVNESKNDKKWTKHTEFAEYGRNNLMYVYKINVK